MFYKFFIIRITVEYEIQKFLEISDHRLQFYIMIQISLDLKVIYLIILFVLPLIIIFL